MQNPALVGVMDGPGDGRHQPRGRAQVARVTLDVRGQIAAVDELHAEIVLALVFADLVDWHDVGMVEVGGGFGFEAKTLEVGGRGQTPGANHLERQHAVQAELPGLVHNAHASLGDHLEQLVIAEVADPRAGRALCSVGGKGGRLKRGGRFSV